MRRRNKGRGIGIPMVGMADVIFLLLIFFILTSSFTSEIDLKINLPEKKTDEQVPPLPEVVLIQVEKSGNVWLGQELVADSTLSDLSLFDLLKERLEGLKAANPEVIIRIKGDSEARYGRVEQVLDAVSEAGFPSPQIVRQVISERGE